MGSAASKPLWLSEAPKIDGVSIEAEIGRGAHSVVYKARRKRLTYALKVAREDPAPAGAETADLQLERRFRREAAALACLNHPRLAAVVDTGIAAGRPYLLQEFVRGETLDARLQTGRLPLDEVLTLATDLASVLDEVHRHQLVHRDIQPRNIMLDQTGRARLIDFGLTTRSLLDNTGDAEVEEVAGTFRYCAPEQSGMLNRGLDGRADLYSVGVVLFECLTGRLPFDTANTAELLRQHAVMPPPDLVALSPGVPPALAAIVSKLLAKDPDDRYATGASLATDLERLEDIDAALRRGDAPALAPQTAHATDLPLVGRRQELGRLLSRWQQASRKKGVVALVEGEPGNGKSRLVREVVAHARTSGALVLTAKCAAAATAPFGALRQAIAAPLGGLATRQDTPDQQQALQTLREAVDEQGPLLARFLPELGALIDSAAPQPVAAEERLFDAAARLLLSLGDPDQPMLLLVDDIQWIDDSSQQVLRRIAQRVSQRAILVLATARNDPASQPALQSFAEAVSHGLGERLRLEPLDPAAVETMVSELLGRRPVAPELARLVLERSGGNPFAVAEYTRALLDGGALVPRDGRWLVDQPLLEELQLPSNVLDLVVRRLASLTSDTATILQRGAVLGARFSDDLLRRVAGVADRKLQAALHAGQRQLLLERSDDAYAFVHDRVREALLSDLGPDELRALHQRTAEVLDALPEGHESRSAYALAQHYTRGEAEAHAQRVYQTNLQAGQLALQSYAHEEALAFFETARQYHELADGEPQSLVYELRAEAAARTTRPERAEQYLREALELTQDPLRRAHLRGLLARTLLMALDAPRGWAELTEALRNLGRPFHRWRFVRALVMVGLLLVGLLRAPLWGRRPRSMPKARRERTRSLINIYESGTLFLFMESRILDLLYVAMRYLVASQSLGRSPELAACHAYLAVIAANIGLRRTSGKLSRSAEKMATSFADPLVLARTHFLISMAKQAAGDAVAGDCVQHANASANTGTGSTRSTSAPSDKTWASTCWFAATPARPASGSRESCSATLTSTCCASPACST